MDQLKKLQEVITTSPEYQHRLTTAMSETAAIAVLLEIAQAEGIALKQADVEHQIATSKQQASEMSEDELASVSGGVENYWYRFQPPRTDW